MHSDPKAWLESEYITRRQKNASYSLRAFARLLDIPSGRVSQLLSEKRKFTPQLGKKIAGRLNYDPRRTEDLLRAIATARDSSVKSSSKPRSHFRSLDMDQFQAIADPLHFSILSLLEIAPFECSIDAIARRLKISRVVARGALRRLERLGLIFEKSPEIFFLRERESRTTSHDVSSAALRASHKKVLQEALDAIDEVAVELRDFTSMTMAIDSSRVPEAKKRIREFRRSISEFLEGGKSDEVFRINIQLVPVTTKEGKQ